MSIEKISAEIKAFLENPTPEVLCIRGKWGVGKTFAWGECLKYAIKYEKVGVKSYAYVSLFGISSLERLKYSIFENTVEVSTPGLQPTIETIGENSVRLSKNLSRKAGPFLRYLGPIFGLTNTMFSGFQSAAFIAVKNMIVCIDDLERKSQSFPMRDVLGLVTYLKEKRKCKVVVIMNDKSLEDGDEREFERFYEKSIDKKIQFFPGIEYAVNVAFDSDDEVSDLLREFSLKLPNKNIRILNRTKNIAFRISPLLADLHPGVLRSVIHSLTMMVWIDQSGEGAPTSEFIMNGGYSYGLEASKPGDEQENEWKKLLRDYEFGQMDELDRVILEGVRTGIFDEDAIKTAALKISDMLEANDGKNTLQEAWSFFHSSFDNNEEEVIERLTGAFQQNVRFLSLPELNGVIRFLRRLEKDELADALIEQFMDVHPNEERRFYDLSRYSFSESIDDEKVRAAVQRKYESLPEMRDEYDVMLRVGLDDSGGSGDREFLSKLDVEAYYDAFKANSNEEISQVIRQFLSFGSIQGEGAESYHEIARKTREALTLIFHESRINKLRMIKFESYGFTPPD